MVDLLLKRYEEYVKQAKEQQSVDFTQVKNEMMRHVVPQNIDPYNTETIAAFINTAETEKQRDEFITRIIKYCIKNFDELANDRLKEYLCSKYGFKVKVVDSITSTMRLEIEQETLKTKPILNFKLDNYMDNIKALYNRQPFFYDKNDLYWFWKKDHWEEIDETDIMILLEKCLYMYGETIKPSVKLSYLEAIKRFGREKQPKEAPVKWVQFKDKAFSLESGNIYQVTPEYFFTNPIPYELGNSIDTPIMDKLFKEWVGDKYLDTLYEIIAYCCYRGYPIQSLFCLYGNGRNGKTCFLKLLNKFIGVSNICSTELDLIAGNNKSRFETLKMYKKLVCVMGETNFGVLSHSSMIKKLTGGDIIGYEKKGGACFDDYSYAKMLIASNSLPITNDTSDGFYRRWVIIPFPNEFPEGKDIVISVPDIEYNNLALKLTKILPDLLQKGYFTNQGTFEERKNNYIMASNPIGLFLKETCEEDIYGYIQTKDLYNLYIKFLQRRKSRFIKRKEFTQLLEEEGLFSEKTAKKNDDGSFLTSYYILGIRLKSLSNLSNLSRYPTQKNELYRETENIDKLDKTDNIQKQIIHTRCKLCGYTPCNYETEQGYLCETCFNNKQMEERIDK